jgi:VIT1/CCC1 family predicted Fe2+/Mn2+ transporter
MLGLHLTRVSFGAASAIVTSIGLIIGFGAAGVPRPTILAGLLIIALADNLTDSLSIHIYQESERLEERAAFRATVSNFATRLVVSLSFVLLVLVGPQTHALVASLLWGLILLTGLTWLVARARKVSVWAEIAKHLGVAAVVIATSRVVGSLIGAYIL